MFSTILSTVKSVAKQGITEYSAKGTFMLNHAHDFEDVNKHDSKSRE